MRFFFDWTVFLSKLTPLMYVCMRFSFREISLVLYAQTPRFTIVYVLLDMNTILIALT